MKQNREARILVVGAALRGSGYPNAINTIKALGKLKNVEVKDIAHWLPENFRLWKLTELGVPGLLESIVRIVGGTIISLFKLLVTYRRNDLLYVPYPSLPTLWVLSWIPQRLRPRCACDAYITLWDTIYQDRGLGQQDSILSKLLLAAESRALRSAENVLTDTTANSSQLSEVFGVTASNIRAIPLAIIPIARRRYAQGTDKAYVDILFMGTFVPLQGTTLISSAISALRDNEYIRFLIVGDGQKASEAEPLLRLNPSVTWVRDWQSPAQLAEHLEQADICLGIFGGPGKASRVLPLKIYMAMAAGKAIITQEAYSTPAPETELPALCISPSAEALVEAIKQLAGDRAARERLGKDAASYYDRHLSEQALLSSWRQLIGID